MRKIDLTGGVSSVQTFPIRRGNGGDLSTPPPASATPPKQFTIPETTFNESSTGEILSDYQGPNRMTDTPGVFSAPNGTGGTMGMLEGAPGARQVFEDRMIMGRAIDPRTVYPNDPDPGIMIPGITDTSRGGYGGIPNLLQANYLQPLGILSINKEYDI